MEDFNWFSHDDIKFTFEFDEENISFVNLKVTSCNGKQMTSLYNKPTDCYQYLHYCSQENDFKEHSSGLESWFLKRSYTEKIIDMKWREF